MLYKRALRKEKEVTTFLINDRMIKLVLDLSVKPCPYQSVAVGTPAFRYSAYYRLIRLRLHPSQRKGVLLYHGDVNTAVNPFFR